MQALIANIENLLIEHDCVVVPGLGGFIQNAQDTYFDESSQTFYPAGKQLTFNARLHFNDGLLCQEYQMRQSLSFDAANQRIRQTVAEMKDYLALHHQLPFGKMGSFSQVSAQDALVFQPKTNNDLSPAAFGLKACAMPSRSKKVVLEKNPASRNVSHWFSRVATVAACLLILFALVKDTHPAQLLQALSSEKAISSETAVETKVQQSSVLPVCTLEQGQNPAVSALAMNTETSLETIMESSVEVKVETESKTTSETFPIAKMESEASQTPKQVATMAISSESGTVSSVPAASGVMASPESVYPSATKQYLIVIASFPNLEQAEQYIQSRRLQDIYPSVGIAVGAERCRVYAEAYQDREEALFFLSEFRENNPKYAKAWVLVF